MQSTTSLIFITVSPLSFPTKPEGMSAHESFKVMVPSVIVMSPFLLTEAVNAILGINQEAAKASMSIDPFIDDPTPEE